MRIIVYTFYIKIYIIFVYIIFKDINLVAFEFIFKFESIIDMPLVYFHNDNLLLNFISFSSKIKLDIM